MQILSNSAFHKYSFWLPIFLFLLPIVMAIIPIIFVIDPRMGLYYTPAVPIVFILLVIAFALSNITLKKQITISANPLHIFIAAVFIAIVGYTTLYVAADAVYSAQKVFDLMLFVGLCFASASIFQRSGHLLVRNTLLAIFAGIVVATLLVVVQFYFKIPQYYNWPYFLPGFIYIRIFGFSLTVGIAMGTGLLVLPTLQKRAVQIVIFASLLGLWVALFWTSSRGGIFSLILVTPVLAFLIPKLRRGLFVSLLAMLIGAYLSSMIEAPSSDFGFSNSFTEAGNYQSLNGFSGYRLNEWGLILDLIAEKPLFGHGYGQALLVAGDVGITHAHVHNIVLEAALSWGWIGVACIGYLILRFWFIGVKNTITSNVAESLPALLVVSVLMQYSWVDGIYFYYQALIPLGICVGALAAKPKQRQ